jgi:NADH-quinone oxidoreductase subunit H
MLLPQLSSLADRALLQDLDFTESWLGGWFTFVWFFLKVLGFFFFFVWLRGTLPRLRYDQFMKFGWKVLIPVNVAWILVVATLRLMTQQGASQFVIAAFTGGVVLAVLLAGCRFMTPPRRKLKRAHTDVGEMPEPYIPCSCTSNHQEGGRIMSDIPSRTQAL